MPIFLLRCPPHVLVCSGSTAHWSGWVKSVEWNQYKSNKRDILKAVSRQRWKYIHDLLQVGLDNGDTKPPGATRRPNDRIAWGSCHWRMGGPLYPLHLSTPPSLAGNDVEQTVRVRVHEGGWVWRTSPPCNGPDCANIPDIHMTQEGW